MTPQTHTTLLPQAEPAPTKRSDPFLQRGEDWVLVGAIAGALLVGAVLVWIADRWRKRIMLGEKRSGEELTSFRAMYERGEITEEEYNRLRTKVADRVKTKPAAAGTAAAPAPTTPAALDPTAGGNPVRPPVPGYFADEDGGPSPAPPRKPWERWPNGPPPPA